MRNRTSEVSQYFGGLNGNSSGTVNGYSDGYSQTQQEVLIGSFLSSYTNTDVNKRTTNPFASLPLPNWTINYNGLSKFEKTKKYVKNFVIRHGYSSSVALGGVQSNLLATSNDNGATARDLNNNFIGEQNIQTVSITERFSPLIGLDATWNIKDQGLITKFEIKKDRSATLALANNQVTEVLGVYSKDGNEKGTWYSDYKSASSVERVEAFIKLGRKDPAPYADETGPVTWEHVVNEVTKILEGHGEKH
jgi:cell surface protein SprA